MFKIALIFPKDSEAMFNIKSTRTFGGASVQMYNLSEAFLKVTPQVYSFIPDYEIINFPDNNKFNLVRMYKEKDSLIKKIFKMHKAIKKNKPDVIIQHGLTIFSCLLALYSRFYKIKFIFWFAHDVEVNGRYQTSQKRCLLFRLLVKFSTVLIIQNKYQQLILSEKKIKPDVRCIYNGFPVKKKRETAGFYLLWVARCDRWKNPELFISLARSLPEHKFYMICPAATDKKYYEDIKKTAEEVKNITFIPFVPAIEIDRYFKNAFLFINTSDHEGYPQTFIQATMNSVPILSYKVDPDGFLTAHNCGYVCGSKIELVKEKISLLYGDKKAYENLSSNAYNYALTHHNIDENVKQVYKLISS